MNPIAEDMDPLSCFFCFAKFGNKCSGNKSGKEGPSDLNCCSVKSICRYLSSGSQKCQNSHSGELSNSKTMLENADLQIQLCGRCDSVRNTLTELIQHWEMIQMKISYWLEALHGILVKADEGNNGDKSLGVCKETRSDAQLVRTEILNKCEWKTR